MRSLIALTAISFAAFCLLAAAPAHSDILYARPDGDAMSGRILDLHRWPLFLTHVERQRDWSCGFAVSAAGGKSRSRLG
jgi:hypothetical protein